MSIQPRHGEAAEKIDRQTFARRFRERFTNLAYRLEEEAFGRLEEIAWTAYRQGRKAPVTPSAGPGFTDPEYVLAKDWHRDRNSA
jgi:hypothetical protein